MSAAARLAAFALLLGALFAAAALAGRAAGPFDRSVAREGAAHGEEEPAEHAGPRPAGLAVAADGLRLDADTTSFDAGSERPFAFAIRADGEPLRQYDVVHERQMHLVVVRRDLGAFLHLHPERQADGSWLVPLRLPDAGAYRAFADFSTGGAKRTLGIDLFAYGGAAAQRPEPAAVRWTFVDGYRVVLLPGERRAGAETALRFAVMRDGRTVGVDRYLGARGHLVVLREGDLAYLHTHAEEEELEFETTFPSAGRYRAFLQFRAGGAVRTATFAIEVPE